MKKEDYAQYSTEDLLKREKTAKSSTSLLAGIVIVQFIVGVYLTYKQGFSVFTVMPFCFLPIVLINYSSAKKIREEINSREK